MDHRYQSPPIPNAFIWRRTHSLTGLWLVLFLIEHLFTNSQAALAVGEDGRGFISAVNWIKSLPYLPLIEITLLAIPFLIHAVWGVRYLMTAKYNLGASDGTTCSLPEYGGNRAYTWQRVTSWLLLIGIFAHVVQMRFLHYPASARLGSQEFYMVPLEEDEGLYSLSKRLHVSLYTNEAIEQRKEEVLRNRSLLHSLKESNPFISKVEEEEENRYAKALTAYPLKKGQILAEADSFGTAELLMVRDVFKSPLMILLYTGLVLAATFHAFNGLWTFMISWGITLTERSQILMRCLATGLMILVSFLGIAAIYGTYWINLRD